MKFHFGFWLMAACAASPASAESFRDFPDLPSLQMVIKAMAGNPAVLAAQNGVKVGEANQEILRAGTYEYNVRLGTQQRTVRVDPTGKFNEWNLSVERPFRLPNKASLDRELGSQSVVQAKLAYGDAMHESGRTLLRMWFNWVNTSQQARQWESQVAILTEQSSIVNKRVKAGDAPKLEAMLVDSALAQAQSTLLQAKLRVRVALTDLTQRFPGIIPPSQLVLTAPEPVTQDITYWREQILEHNHELGLARAESKHWQLMASRASADRMPDPSVGLHLASERGGEDRIAGLSVSIALPGGARSANANMMQAQNAVALQKEAAVLARLNAEVNNQYATAQASYGSWQSIRDAAAGIQRNAELMARAYSLGEAGLTDVLTARKQSIEANLDAMLAQTSAAESRYRLMLDAHQLWPLDSDEDEDTSHAHY